jgi:hypothetical protein
MSDEYSGARNKPVSIDLPEIVDIPSLDRALSAVIAKAAVGEITPRVGLDFTRMMETRRRALSDVHLDQRLTQMVEIQKARKKAKEGGR